jgi:hypothetical protein
MEFLPYRRDHIPYTPQIRGKVVLIQINNPARCHGDDVDGVGNDIDVTRERINSLYGDAGYTPMVMIDGPVPMSEKAAYYAAADSCVVSAVRDGLDRIPYFYTVCREEGASADGCATEDQRRRRVGVRRLLAVARRRDTREPAQRGRRGPGHACRAHHAHGGEAVQAPQELQLHRRAQRRHLGARVRRQPPRREPGPVRDEVRQPRVRDGLPRRRFRRGVQEARAGARQTGVLRRRVTQADRAAVRRRDGARRVGRAADAAERPGD